MLSQYEKFMQFQQFMEMQKISVETEKKSDLKTEVSQSDDKKVVSNSSKTRKHVQASKLEDKENLAPPNL